MKKALTKVLLTAFTLVILAAIVPLSANASSSNKNELKTEIFSYLTDEMNLNSAAACGVMANIDEESDFNPRLVITDTNGLLSGGLCQWNGGRFSRLRAHCKQKGISYLSVEGQLSYLKKELSSKAYGYIYDYLKDVPDTAQGAYDAAHYWCYYFEVPGNRYSKSISRGNAAKNKYWKAYGNKKLSELTLSIAEKDTSIDIDDSLKFKWTSAGKDADRYVLRIAKKNEKTGNWSWNKAKVYVLSGESLSKKIKAEKLTTGDYKAYVRAENSATDINKKSNSVYFTVNCETHEFKETVTKQPTSVEKGRRTLICTQCGEKTKEAVATFTIKDFTAKKIAKLKASKTGENFVKLKWKQLSWATGYYVYMKKDGEWTRIKTVKDFEQVTHTVKGLKSGKKYKFYVQGYYKHGGKTYRTQKSDVFTVRTK
ncbi:MAG: fibronectin type III domain-containing protein [Clostridia bacterium]|nr:fibronectin type III domain-containing protein [Clostridia bacterium]